MTGGASLGSRVVKPLVTAQTSFVGFREDTVYLSKGVKTPGNGALVEKAVRIIDELGGRVATVDEARGILDLRRAG